MPINALEKIKEAIASQDVKRLFDSIIQYAVKTNSSDIHIEPRKTDTVIRSRVDGMLKSILTYNIDFHAKVVSKIKILSELKIDESRVPQDGRIKTSINNIDIDLRVSTFPTIHGEKIVFRILNASESLVSLENLGLEGNTLDRFKKSLKLTSGIILNTGPTGSGKTTTLYTALSVLNKDNVNIVTIEDPVEYQINGINQSQIKPKVGYYFSTGFKSILRQDPDIVMVGEIRDRETVDTAIEASLTGHLVLSTLHTNSAIETITRLLDMGVKRYLLSSSVKFIMAQRLVRRLCPNCIEKIRPTEEFLQDLKKEFKKLSSTELFNRVSQETLKDIYIYNSKGCEKCNYDGYSGRIGIYEILEFTDNIKKAILDQKSVQEIEIIALQEKMISIKSDGFIKVLNGITTIEEIYRVLNV